MMMNKCTCQNLWGRLSGRSRDGVKSLRHYMIRRCVPSSDRTLSLVGFSLAISAGLAAGCRTTGDTMIERPSAHQGVTTPSVEAVRAATVEATVAYRDYEVTQMRAKDGSVTHGPLYFEDPFEEKGGEAGTFAWSGLDYEAWFYGVGRFSVNTVMFPISAVMTPPWQLMTSDGHASPGAWGEDHDAEP